jgi:hypothetical protein
MLLVWLHVTGCVASGVPCVVQEDPELKPMFEQIQTGGLAALQKAMSDPVSATPLHSARP